jgi:hypothetical protein
MIRLVSDAPREDQELIRQLTQWFQDTVGELYGGINCRDILRGDPDAKKTRCPGIIGDTYQFARELLEDNGYL